MQQFSDDGEHGFLEERWSGWRIQGHVDGIVRQVQLSGRDPSDIAIPDERALQECHER
jgi:hypothetical protein